MLLGNLSLFAQSDFTLRWSSEVGCLTYGEDREKELPLEDIENDKCVKVCEGSTVMFELMFDNQTQQVDDINWNVDGSMEEARKSMFIIKYDDQGNFQWLQEPEGPVNYFGAPLQKTVIEPSGRTHTLVRFGPGIHLEGQLTVTDPISPSVIIIYDANGNLENFITFDMLPGVDSYDYQLAYDPNLDRYYIADTRRQDGSLSINGFGVASGEDKAFYLAALDNQGQVVWYHENVKKKFLDPR